MASKKELLKEIADLAREYTSADEDGSHFDKDSFMLDLDKLFAIKAKPRLKKKPVKKSGGLWEPSCLVSWGA